ncbi:ribonuclease HI [Halobacteriovorax sp. JY17]|uniref:ribonuclease HI n=1 Tax=Halobacteriovorax sp. JY17 TaxID=2014617 RepID=UPI0025BCE1EE|nr:ribonuclease HI [Halobacteriovorax sp. JY17]
MKKKTLAFFDKLKSKFPDDKKALSSIDYLKSQIEDWEEEVEEQNSTNGELPLPKEIKSKNAYALFSDGACRGNPGPGAWGMVGQNAKGEVLFKGSGVETTTTNNRMEMMGAIEAMKYLLSEGVNTDSAEVYLYSDSKYVVDGLKSWMQGWKNRGWKKADKKTPENVDLWQELDRISSSFSNIQYLWVKGHAGHPQNELCDQLANEALDDSGF